MIDQPRPGVHVIQYLGYLHRLARLERYSEGTSLVRWRIESGLWNVHDSGGSATLARSESVTSSRRHPAEATVDRLGAVDSGQCPSRLDNNVAVKPRGVAVRPARREGVSPRPSPVTSGHSGLAARVGRLAQWLGLSRPTSGCVSETRLPSFSTPRRQSLLQLLCCCQR